jgi:lysophospholipase L1-like esterase
VAIITALAIAATVVVIARNSWKLGAPSELNLDPSKIATRIPAGRLGSLDNSTPKTFQATYELVDQFDAVRIIFGSNSRGNIAITKSAVSAPSSADDINNSSGEWSVAKRQGETEFAIPIAPSGGSQMAYAVTDWVPLASAPRSDDGTHPLLTVRAELTPNSELPVLGNGKDNFTNWATRSDGGRKFWWRHQDGDQISSPSDFTSTTNQSQSPILGVQYLSRNEVVSVAAVGDSITEGRGTYRGEGFVLPALEELNGAGGPKKYEYANLGWSGQNPSIYSARALTLMESEIKPDVLVFPAGSPNPASSGALSDDAVKAIHSQLSTVIDSARRHDVVPVVWTWLPTNTAVRQYGPSDIKRVAYNREILGTDASNALLADAAGPVSGAIVNDQVELAVGTTNDGIHPNDAGNSILKDVIKPVIATAAELSLGR